MNTVEFGSIEAQLETQIACLGFLDNQIKRMPEGPRRDEEIADYQETLIKIAALKSMLS